MVTKSANIKVMPARGVGVKDIAVRLNVAVSTVSRALSGDSSISQKRITEIRTIAEELGYRPKPMRRNVKRAIALMIATDSTQGMQNKYYQNLVYEVEKRASEIENHVHIQFYDRRTSTKCPQLILENRVDGVLLAGHPSVEFCKSVKREQIPVAVLNDLSSRTGFSSVRCNVLEATREAVIRLIELGHRQIGTVVTNREYPAVEDRYQAYLSALNDKGIAPEYNLTVFGVDPNIVGGRNAVRAFLDYGHVPTAIVFANDWMALGGRDELLRRGYRVPEDVSIIGHDNDFICEELEPQLTSVDMRLEEIVKNGFDLLQDQVNGKAYEIVNKVVDAKLIWRESCCACKAINNVLSING